VCGHEGSELTTRRAVAAAKRAGGPGTVGSTGPWIPEPGSWVQWGLGRRATGGGPGELEQRRQLVDLLIDRVVVTNGQVES
jgi:hypothetical protein